MDTLKLRNKLTNGHDLTIEECDYLKSLMSVVVSGERALCPFGCVGGELGLYQLPDSDSRHVFCETCGASGPWGETNEEAERLWNNRTVVFTEQERNDLIDETMSELEIESACNAALRFEPALASRLEDEIGRRGLIGDYIAALWDVIGAGHGSNFWTQSNIEAFWKCIRATPEQRCRAALVALRATVGREPQL